MGRQRNLVDGRFDVPFFEYAEKFMKTLIYPHFSVDLAANGGLMSPRSALVQA